MKIGIHLPQFGRAAGADAIRDAAKRAEELGFADVWVSDHIIVPAAQDYPSPYLFDPMMTSGVGRGGDDDDRARHERARRAAVPPALARQRARQPRRVERRPAHGGGGRGLVGGRVRRARPVVPRPGSAHRRDHRRAAGVLAGGPVVVRGELYRFDDIRLLPKPAHDIPIWVGGSADATYRRAVDARRRLPRDRARHRRRARRGDTRPARAAGRVVHHLAAHGLGPAGHGPRPHPAGASRVGGGGSAARGRRAVAATTATTSSARWNCWPRSCCPGTAAAASR